MSDQRLARQRKLRDAIVEAHLDGLLVSGLSNIRYLTGFTGSNALLLITATRALLITDFRYKTQASEECTGSCDVRIEQASLWNGLWDALPGMSGLHALGFEAAQLLVRDHLRIIEKNERWHWRPTTDLVERLRGQKDAGEIKLIQKAAHVATDALAATLDAVRLGQSELEICGILERQLRACGSYAHPFAPIVASGERSALPHARPSKRVVLPGDLLLLDFGATVDGYCSDITRTVVVGSADARQREVYEVVREANQRAAAGVVAGMTGMAADAIARDWIASQGLGDAFGHGLGHGIGLDVHESPRLSRLSDETLLESAVVTIEPGVYVPEWGGVRIEDDVVVTPTGATVLTEFPRDLIEVGQ